MNVKESKKAGNRVAVLQSKWKLHKTIALLYLWKYLGRHWSSWKNMRQTLKKSLSSGELWQAHFFSPGQAISLWSRSGTASGVIWLKTKLVHNKCRTARLKQVSDSEIGSKKIPLHWLCLDSVPHMLDTCLGNRSNIMSIRNSYRLSINASLMYTTTAAERKVSLS